MTLYDSILMTSEELNGRRFVFTDFNTFEGKLVSPAVYEFHHAMLEFKIWYLGLYLTVRALLRGRL